MPLRPLDPKDGRRRGLNEEERGKLKRERERTDFYRRNPHLKPSRDRR